MAPTPVAQWLALRKAGGRVVGLNPTRHVGCFSADQLLRVIWAEWQGRELTQPSFVHFPDVLS